MSKNDDEPPMSRLFVLCSKNTSEDAIRENFEKFGTIEDIWVVKDKHTGDNKGVAYIKFAKTSDAAAAQEQMNGEVIDNEERPIKVLVAASRQAGSGRVDNEEERYLRLFLVISKTATKEDIEEEFEKYGEIDSVIIVKDRKTRESKGFSYVKYKKFTHAANAIENCPAKYKAVFAKPQSSAMNDRKRSISPRRGGDRGYDDNYDGGYSRDSSRGGGGGGGGGRGYGGYDNMGFGNSNGGNMGGGLISDMANFLRLKRDDSKPTTLEVICSSSVNQDQLWRLFDIVPGLDYCHITRECGPRNQNATVVYTNPRSAAHAKEKLHGLEYPPGERLIVRASNLDPCADTTFVDHQLSKDSFCSVPLPPAKPMANPDDNCAARCFIVLSSNVPVRVLKSVFCTFGGLIDVYLLPNKNCGYVKYTSVESAEDAIQTLTGAEVYGVRLKIMTAEEPRDNKRMRTN